MGCGQFPQLLLVWVSYEKTTPKLELFIKHEASVWYKIQPYYNILKILGP